MVEKLAVGREGVVIIGTKISRTFSASSEAASHE